MDKEHTNNCSVCGQEFDMRDLSQVFAHEPCDGKHKDYNNIEQIQFVSSKKMGSPEIFYKKLGNVNLN